MTIPDIENLPLEFVIHLHPLTQWIRYKDRPLIVQDWDTGAEKQTVGPYRCN